MFGNSFVTSSQGTNLTNPNDDAAEVCGDNGDEDLLTKAHITYSSLPSGQFSS